MQHELYRGYAIWGHAIAQQEEVIERERFAVNGTVTEGGKFMETLGILGVADSESEAEKIGLESARPWVDNHA